MSQTSLFAPRSDLNGAAPTVTVPAVPGQTVGLPSEAFFLPERWLYPVVLFLGTGQGLPACIRDGYVLDLLDFGGHLDAGDIPFGGVSRVNSGPHALLLASSFRA